MTKLLTMLAVALFGLSAVAVAQAPAGDKTQAPVAQTQSQKPGKSADLLAKKSHKTWKKHMARKPKAEKGAEKTQQAPAETPAKAK